eukprot:TRINITY_DN18165_c0_g1_i1.p1 TRINITY_DN18165_c0_g1~~TRINITY_DN18165_c0_g1_i1.p1  ORF type:complete len:500 (-),score=144.75 TRINITY_DN18165_c0_g1_i1:38-1486(-)
MSAPTPVLPQSQSASAASTTQTTQTAQSVLFDEATALTHSAIDLDSTGHMQHALVEYRKGVILFQRSIGEATNSDDSNALVERANSHIEQINERIDHLQQKIIQSSKPQKDKPSESFIGSIRNFISGTPDGDAVQEKPTKPKNAPLRSTADDLHRTQSVSAIGSKKEKIDEKPKIFGPPKVGMEIFHGVDKKCIESVLNEVIDHSPGVCFDDIGGLAQVKQALNEAVILPSLRPDIFNGLRAPAKGLLLFGPPGNGKTMVAKAVASESKSRFFSISASSLTSKWVGESEKLVRALFAVARYVQPSIIFIDEIDSILSARSAEENEGSRRLKTEFLIQFDGVGSNSEDRVLVMGATNRPQDIDEAARRRLAKRIYVPLPEPETRGMIIKKLLKGQHQLSPQGLRSVVDRTEGYSGSDLTMLCREAALVPLRQLGANVRNVAAEDVRLVSLDDFKEALKMIRPSVSQESLRQLEEWNNKYGAMQ